MCLRKVVINPAVVLVAIELLGKTRREVVSYIAGTTKIRRRQKAEQLHHGSVRGGQHIDLAASGDRLTPGPIGIAGRGIKNHPRPGWNRSEEHTSELQSPCNL